MIDPTLLVGILAQALAASKWKIRRGEGEGSARPDLILTDPNGKVYLIELKRGEDPTHFATIAQVERAASRLSEQEGEEVTPVLLTTQSVDQGISNLADKVGVEVVKASDSTEDAAESLVQRLAAK